MVPFEASDYCTCSFDGQSGTVSIELHGMTSHGWTNGTFIVESAAPILPTPVDWQRRPAMERSRSVGRGYALRRESRGHL